MAEISRRMKRGIILWLIVSLLLVGLVDAETCEEKKANNERIFYLDPISGQLGNDGSINSPWPSLYSVYSAGYLNSIVTDGDILCLLDGRHGGGVGNTIDISSGLNHNSMVQIVAQEGHGAKFGKFSFNSARNLIIDGIKVSPSYADQYFVYTDGANGLIKGRYTNENVILRNIEIFSVKIEDALNWNNQEWRDKRSGAWGILLDGDNKNVVVENIKMYMVLGGVSLNGQNVFIRNCSLDVYGPGDAYNLGGTGPLFFENNKASNIIRFINVWMEDEEVYYSDGVHADFFQIGPTAATNGATIRNNFFLQETPEHPVPILKGDTQGIFGGQSCNPCTIESNIVINSHNHGINLAASMPNTKIIGNTVIGFKEDLKNSPIYADGSNAIVANNIGTAFYLGEGVQDINNIEITRYQLSDYFVDPANMDFHLKLGSPAIDVGNNNYLPSDGKDFEGDIKPQNGIVDVGADEYLFGIQQQCILSSARWEI